MPRSASPSRPGPGPAADNRSGRRSGGPRPAQSLTPSTWTHRDGYQLSTEPADWIAYERACLRIELTRISRFLSSTVIPHAQKPPDDDWVQRVLGRLTGAKSALGLLVCGT